jgi:hypothetical protein
MNTEKAIRIVAGTLILISISLAHFTHTPAWLLLGLFVGINLIQSALTGFCPAEIILRKLGVPSSCSMNK